MHRNMRSVGDVPYSIQDAINQNRINKAVNLEVKKCLIAQDQKRSSQLGKASNCSRSQRSHIHSVSAN